MRLRRVSLMSMLAILLVGASAVAQAPESAEAPDPTTHVLLPLVDGAQATTTRMGPNAHSTTSNGTSVSSTEVGRFLFTQTSDGRAATTTRAGNSSLTTFSDGSSATATKVGQTTFTQFSNGVTGTSMTSGNTTVTTMSDGRIVTTTVIGGIEFTNTSGPPR